MKTDTVFVCSQCARQFSKWMGRCPGCGEWNTVIERRTVRSRSYVNREAAPEEGQRDAGGIVPIADVAGHSQDRIRTGIEEFDRVLGGGIVRSSVVLVGGDPGIGKSTLLMQALEGMARTGEQVLYVSGEESAEQLKLRAERLNVHDPRFLVLTENRLESVLQHMEESGCSVVVVDSIQSLSCDAVESGAGSVLQVRHAAAAIVDAVKRGSAGCLIVGHVTKGGDLAGPKILEHMVDTVLSFEGDRGHPYRILRASKNRFGSASEIGVFEMGDAGLREVANPSELFLSERPLDASGSVVTALMEGSRPLLVEIQALVSGPVAGQGRRTCLGTDPQRLALMIAVLEKKLGLTLGDQDIFLNVVGGVRAVEPAADLAIATAVLSSFADRPVPAGSVIIGEVGLAGEVRRVSRAAPRVNEAFRLGFKKVLAPRSNLDLPDGKAGVEIVGVASIGELASLLFEW